MDEFETIKAQVRVLKREVPSRGGCLARLEQIGVVGPIAFASVEAVFEEARPESVTAASPLKSKELVLTRIGSSAGVFARVLVLLALAVILPTWILVVGGSVGFLSVVHLGSIGLSYWVLDSVRRVARGQPVAVA